MDTQAANCRIAPGVAKFARITLKMFTMPPRLSVAPKWD